MLVFLFWVGNFELDPTFMTSIYFMILLLWFPLYRSIICMAWWMVCGQYLTQNTTWKAFVAATRPTCPALSKPTIPVNLQAVIAVADS